MSRKIDYLILQAGKFLDQFEGDETDVLAEITADRISVEKIPESGVYFLWLHDELQYVGQSRQVLARIGQHRVGPGKKEFTHFTVIDVPKDLLLFVERLFIETFEPPGNKL